MQFGVGVRYEKKLGNSFLGNNMVMIGACIKCQVMRRGVRPRTITFNCKIGLMTVDNNAMVMTLKSQR